LIANVLIGEIAMERFAAICAVLTLIASASIAVTPAQAQKNNASCSQSACEQACSSKGGRQCARYCSNEMARRGCH
jgi:hypothetical protein